MWRTLIGAVLWRHDGMARGPTETGGIHILHTAIRSGSNDQDIQNGCKRHPLERPPDHRNSKINRWIGGRQCPRAAQSTPAQPNANRNQQQTKSENSGQDKEDQDSNIRMRRSRQEEVVEPESDHAERGTGGQHRTRKRDRILAEKINWPGPIANVFSNTHFNPSLLLPS